MGCRALVVGFLALSACFGETPVVELEARAFVDVVPPLPAERHDGVAAFRWHVLEAPDDSIVARVGSVEPRPMFQFDRRGTYLLDRWIVSGLSERLTHYLVVTVSGVAPDASVTGSTYVGVGEFADLDARASSSRELRFLTYRWKLTTRPAVSQLVIPAAATDAERFSIAPDVEGFYVFEVVVFDGELWSEPAAIMVEAHD